MRNPPNANARRNKLKRATPAGPLPVAHHSAARAIAFEAVGWVPYRVIAPQRLSRHELAGMMAPTTGPKSTEYGPRLPARVLLADRKPLEVPSR